MKKFLLLAFISLALNSCIYPFEADLSGETDENLVIDGDILIGEETIIKVSRVSPLSGMLEASLLYPQVTVSVERQGGSSITGTAYGSGKYRLDTENLDPDGTYRLLVVNLETGKRYVSPWQKAYEAPLIPSMFSEVSEDCVRMCAKVDASASSAYFRMDFEETWEYSADFRPGWMYVVSSDSGDDTEDPANIYRAPYSYEDYYYCWASSKNVLYNLATTENLSTRIIESLCYTSVQRTSKKLQIMYSALLTLRPISSDAYGYYDNLQKNSSTSGSLFSPVPSEVRGNLRCESDTSEFVTGYVSVCRRVQKRFILDCQRQSLYKTSRNPEDDLFVPEVDEDGYYNFSSHYSADERPVRTFPTGDETPTKTNMYWAPRRCTDCRASGGSKSKPSYWPNDHE